MANLDLYNRYADAPKSALREIKAGNLKGKSDINPMWRIKCLTEAFGPCGFGWYTEIVDKWVEEAGGETCAWVICNLYLKDPQSGEWSKPITGMGGNKQTGKGKGDGINEEAFKMAETDAISVCCKKLGIAANVYWNADDTKYSKYTTAPSAPAPTPSALPSMEPPTKPVVAEGNERWDAAIAYCLKANKNATDLLARYIIKHDDMVKLQRVIDARRVAALQDNS